MNSSGSTGWLYVAACLAVPALWGVASAWIFGKIDAKRKANQEEQAWRPPVDYSI